MSRPEAYDASAIQTLEGLAAVRSRPAMYIGDTGPDGLAHLLWEILDNAVDEGAGGHAQFVSVVLHSDGSVTVADDGRGIPVGNHPEHAVSAVEVVFTELHSGGKFGNGAYKIAGGLHGVGASVVNAMSKRVDVTVFRSSKEHTLSFADQQPGHYSPSGRFKPGHELRTRRCPKSKTGTVVRWWPDMDLFQAEPVVDVERVQDRAQQAAYLVAGLEISVTDERTGDTAVYQHRDGLRDLVTDRTDASTPITPAITLRGSDIFTEKVPVDGTVQQVERECLVEAALRWTDGHDTDITSYVNTIPTPDGGTHMAGLERALTRTINAELLDGARRLARLAKSGHDKANGQDVQEGLTAAVRVTLPEPQFKGQTKQTLGTPAVTSIVHRVVADGLRDWIAANKRPAAALTRKIADAVIARVEASDRLAASRRANRTQTTPLPAKLSDCRNHGPGSELLLVEGDSAAGPAKRGRDSAYMAVLPLRGKIVNAAKATDKQVLDNAEASAIFTAVGAGVGPRFDLAAARYGRIVILCDADVDGSHIRCLLLTLIHRWMRPMLDNGRVFSAQPPLYSARIGDKTLRAFSDEERDQLTAQITKRRRKTGSEIKWQRFKGLGEMNADELRHCALDPATRALRRLTIADAAEAEAAAEMIETLMGGDVGRRRDWIIDNSHLMDQAAIDA